MGTQDVLVILDVMMQQARRWQISSLPFTGEQKEGIRTYPVTFYNNEPQSRLRYIKPHP